MSALLAVAELRWKLLLRSTLTRYTRAGRAAAPIRLLFGAAVLVGLFFGVILPVTSGLGGALGDASGRASLPGTLAWGLSAAAIVMFFYAVMALVTSLTANGDLRLLLLSPLSPRIVVGSRLLSAAAGFYPILLLGVPGLVATGRDLHFGPSYDIVLGIAVLVIPVLPVSMAALLVLAVLHWIPPARARTLATILGVTLGAGFYLGSQLLFTGGGIGIPSGSSSLPAALPTTWPGHAIAAAGLGDSGGLLAYGLGSLLLATVVLTVAIEVGARVLATGFASYHEVGRRAPARRPGIRHARRSLIPAPLEPWFVRLRWWPLVAKDWRTLRRDPQGLAGLLYPLLIISFSVYRAVARSTREGDSGFGLTASLSALPLMVVLTIVSVMLLNTIVPAALNREGRALYLLALAPLTTRQLYTGKLVFCLLPITIIVSMVFVAGSLWLSVGLGAAVILAIALVLLVPALGAGNLTIHLIWPRVGQATSRRLGSSISSWLSLVVSALHGLLACGLVGIALYTRDSRPLLAGASLGGLVVLLVGSLALSFALGTRLLHRLLTSDPRP